jgi:hypothetical protein
MGKCNWCHRWDCICCQGYTNKYGEICQAEYDRDYDEVVYEHKTASGATARTYSNRWSAMPSIGDMKTEGGGILMWDGDGWVEATPAVAKAAGITVIEETSAEDNDASLISERRRIVQIIEEAVGPRLKPHLIDNIAAALQAEGFRQD